MTQWSVRWEIDCVGGETPKDAANIARAILLDLANEANHFTVTDDWGNSHEVDADLEVEEDDDATN